MLIDTLSAAIRRGRLTELEHLRRERRALAALLTMHQARREPDQAPALEPVAMASHGRCTICGQPIGHNQSRYCRPCFQKRRRPAPRWPAAVAALAVAVAVAAGCKAPEKYQPSPPAGADPAIVSSQNPSFRYNSNAAPPLPPLAARSAPARSALTAAAVAPARRYGLAWDQAPQIRTNAAAYLAGYWLTVETRPSLTNAWQTVTNLPATATNFGPIGPGFYRVGYKPKP